MRMTRDQLEAENARLQDVAVAAEMRGREADARALKAENAMHDETKRADSYAAHIDKQRKQISELMTENHNLLHKLRDAEEALRPVRSKLERCLGWIACKSGHDPFREFDNEIPF